VRKNLSGLRQDHEEFCTGDVSSGHICTCDPAELRPTFFVATVAQSRSDALALQPGLLPCYNKSISFCRADLHQLLAPNSCMPRPMPASLCYLLTCQLGQKAFSGPPSAVLTICLYVSMANGRSAYKRTFSLELLAQLFLGGSTIWVILAKCLQILS
jgi:hypothetical protein